MKYDLFKKSQEEVTADERYSKQKWVTEKSRVRKYGHWNTI